MEFKHFSHHHGLVLHHIAQESEIHCSGCKSPGSGEFYVCWQCSYYLHGQCFTAARSLKHPSHPLHPLTLIPFPTHPSGSFLCNTCHKSGDGLSYSCSACEFDVHVNCAHMSNASNNLVTPPYPNTNNPIYPPPIQTTPYPPIYPPTNPTIPNATQTYPPQPQITSYPPDPNNTYPNFTPTAVTPPPSNESQSYNSFHQAPGVHPNPAFPQPNEPQSYNSFHQAPGVHPNPACPQPNDPQSYNSFHQTHGVHQNPGFPQPNGTHPPQSYDSFHQTHGMHQNPGFPQPNGTPPPQNYVAPANYPPATNPLPPQPNPTTPTYATTNPPTTTPPQTNAPRPKPPINMIKHFSHPHVLKPMDIERKNKKVCSACEIELSGSGYCCTEPHCTFNLHKACFDSPRELRHKSHLQHPLALVPSPPYSDGFTCNACLKDGKAFAYTCATCSYDLHIDCVQWPDTVTRQDHKHPLTLYYSSPAAETTHDVTFMCDMCKNPVHEMAWVYYCRECNFGTHLECVASGIKQQDSGGAGGGTSQEDLITETELKFAVLQLLLEAQGRKAALESI